MIVPLRIPSAIYRSALDKAGSDTALTDLLVRYVTQYATGETSQAKAGRARQATLSPSERSARARAAAQARWQREP